VRELLHGVGALAPPPRPQPAEPRAIGPLDDKVTGFVFKVQANMDPQHRDRIAFVRLCSGRFQRGMKLKHMRTGRMMAVTNPVFFLARDRNLAEEAYPGDILGIPNHGTLRIGDTLTEGEELKVTGIPNFAPEILRRVRLDDPMKSKHLKRALEQMAEEGITRVIRPLIGADWIVGVVGPLQIEVLAERIRTEYDLKMHFEAAPYETARWVACPDKVKLKRFLEELRGSLGEDHDGAPVFLARNAWELNRTIKDWPDVQFHATREQA
jgi:peptide chain release factor 3